MHAKNTEDHCPASHRMLIFSNRSLVINYKRILLNILKLKSDYKILVTVFMGGGSFP